MDVARLRQELEKALEEKRPVVAVVGVVVTTEEGSWIPWTSWSNCARIR